MREEEREGGREGGREGEREGRSDEGSKGGSERKYGGREAQRGKEGDVVMWREKLRGSTWENEREGCMLAKK